MCKKEFNWKKVIFLCAEIVFYRWSIYIIFLISGYEAFNLKEFVKTFFVLSYDFGKGFSSSFLGLYVLIPFINKLLKNLNKKEFEHLILTLLILFTGLSSFLLNSAFEYIGWYVTVYLIGSYIQIYEIEWMKNKKITGICSCICLLISWLSVVFIRFFAIKLNRTLPYFYFVNDSNKIFAILTSISLFLFFKNLKIGYCKIINTLAASTFGVLLIHASSDTMRKWLWQDICQNVKAFNSDFFILHAFICTFCVYFICVLIDLSRKKIISLFIKK